jgi:hypothetical protein
MHFTKLVPELYYKDISSATKTFIDCLEFTITHNDLKSDNPFCVVSKGDLSLMIFQNAEYAAQYTPLLRLVTNDIEVVHKKVKTIFPELLHPNLPNVTMRPWGAKRVCHPRWTNRNCHTAMVTKSDLPATAFKVPLPISRSE